MSKKKTNNQKKVSLNTQSNRNIIPTKHELCLLDLLDAGMTGISKLTPSRSNDTCLNTTVSELCLNRGFNISREMRPYINSAGFNRPFMWYWLPDHEQALRACEVINHLRAKRKADLLTNVDIESLCEAFPVMDNKGAA